MNKITVVTGGASGIGLAICNKFASSKGIVVILDIDIKKGEKIAKSNSRIHFLYCDITKPDDLSSAFLKIKKDFEGIDNLIVNAGISIRHKFKDLDIIDWHKVINVNLNGAFYTVKEGLPYFKKGIGNIIFTASTNGIAGYPFYADYNCSKAAVISLTKSLALELAPQIRVNAICPGYVMTPMQQREYTPKMIEKVNDKIPLGRHAKPFEIASLFFYLASEDANFITGTAIVIDGGELSGGTASFNKTIT